MRLRTFGGLWIEGEQPPAALGPRRLGLLALVAASGRRGISRERALGILWPEAEQELARHTLSQTLYSLKRDTGRDWIVAGTELRLDPAIGSDVGELQDALAAGDHEAAARLYSGVFLEGFYVPGAPEFERWVEDERARFRDAVTRAAEQAAVQADRKGDYAAAVRVWTRLTELDPLSARYAAGRMRVLAAAGDRASALDHARRHEALVRRELDAEVDPAIRQLVLALKAERPSAPPVAGIRPVSASITAGAAPEPSLSNAPPDGEPERVSSRSRPRWVAALLLGVALLLVFGVTMLRPSKPRQIPFLAVGALRTPELGDTSSLGPMLRDMLATSLGEIDGMQVVANSRLVELTPPALANEPSATADAARRAGATEVMEGELITEAGQLVLTLRRVDLGSGMVRKGYVVRATERYALVDSAAATVARDLGLAPPALAVRDVRTSSPEAYLLYNEGLRAYYSFDSPGAYRLFNAALERDSSFAMAAYYAWNIGHFFMDAVTVQREFERMKRLAPRTSERERLMIQAEAARREAPIRVAVAIAETLAVRYPTDPDGHILLGHVRNGEGDLAGAVASFEKAIAIDSAAGSTTGPYCRMCLALGHMTHTYMWWDSAGAAERAGRRLIALRPDEPKHWASLGEALLRQGRRAEAEAAVERSGTGGLTLVQLNAALHRDLLRWSRLEELDRELLSDLMSPSLEIRGDARWLLLLSLRDQGRLREGRALALENRIPESTRRVQGLGPELILSATLLQGMERPDSAAKLLHAEARRVLASTDRPPGWRARDATWRLTLAGTAYAAAGDTALVRRLADSVEVIGKGSNFGRDPLLHHYLRGIRLQHAGRHAEAVDQLRRSVWSVTDGYTQINLTLARSLLALGRAADAIAVLRPAIHGGVDGSNTYTSRTELHEAMALAFERAGQGDNAMVHWRTVESAWRRADPELRARYERARAAALGNPARASSRSPQ
ncbi:MAG TPA: BTAD domain-containing putative transcriptional regulator [Gemmatimonadales bacterium]|nr:BTAD domain-containing putative transcriptional regulator [Gemmatimonadales bacterium]